MYIYIYVYKYNICMNVFIYVCLFLWSLQPFCFQEKTDFHDTQNCFHGNPWPEHLVAWIRTMIQAVKSVETMIRKQMIQ